MIWKRPVANNMAHKWCKGFFSRRSLRPEFPMRRPQPRIRITAARTLSRERVSTQTPSIYLGLRSPINHKPSRAPNLIFRKHTISQPAWLPTWTSTSPTRWFSPLRRRPIRLRDKVSNRQRCLPSLRPISMPPWKDSSKRLLTPKTPIIQTASRP